MDLNEMRQRYREKKAQEEGALTPQNVEENSTASSLEQSKDTALPKSGDSSTVSLSEISYNYKKGASHVTFYCSRLDNTSGESTGLLSLCCWISENTRENGDWQNDNYAFVDSIDLGCLEKGYGFPDINRTFEIPDNLVKVINDMNNDEEEWHFIFTINELHEDGNNYIIYTINGQNENEGIKLLISDDSISVVIDQDGNPFVYIDGEEFSGTLCSSNERFEIEFKKSVATSIWCYHKNGALAVGGNIDEDSTSVYFDDQDNEMNEDVFEKKYGQEFEKIIAAGFAELESRVENNTSHNNSTTFFRDSTVFSRVQDIVVERLGVDKSQVKPEASFTNDLGADSLDAVELIMEFEKAFNINIPDEIAKTIYTVGDAVKILEKNI